MGASLMELISRNALDYCRKQGWAGLESGSSWPIPVLADGSVHLAYLLYWSQKSDKEQVFHQPFASILVSYPDGNVLNHQKLPASSSPSTEIGRFPFGEFVDMPSDERRAVWDELFALYPGAIAAYAGWPAQLNNVQLARFAHLMSLAVPSFWQTYYYPLNPQFFDWLKSHTPVSVE